MELKNKNVVITGASRGLGAALAKKLASKGAKVYLIARNEKDLKDVALEIKKKGSFAEYFVCDIRKPDEVEKTIKKIAKVAKQIDILINNAGVWFQGPTDEHPNEKIKEVFEVNIMGMIYSTKAVLPLMKKRKTGQILNIISTAALHPDGGWGVYTASKYAGKGYTESLKEELQGTGIKVMAFYPGGMDTNLFFDAGFNKKSEPWMLKLEDVTDVLEFMLTRPDDVCVESLSLRKFS